MFHGETNGPRMMNLSVYPPVSVASIVAAMPIHGRHEHAAMPKPCPKNIHHRNGLCHFDTIYVHIYIYIHF